MLHSFLAGSNRGISQCLCGALVSFPSEARAAETLQPPGQSRHTFCENWSGKMIRKTSLRVTTVCPCKGTVFSLCFWLRFFEKSEAPCNSCISQRCETDLRHCRAVHPSWLKIWHAQHEDIQASDSTCKLRHLMIWMPAGRQKWCMYIINICIQLYTHIYKTYGTNVSIQPRHLFETGVSI